MVPCKKRKTINFFIVVSKTDCISRKELSKWNRMSYCVMHSTGICFCVYLLSVPSHRCTTFARNQLFQLKIKNFETLVRLLQMVPLHC